MGKQDGNVNCGWKSWFPRSKAAWSLSIAFFLGACIGFYVICEYNPHQLDARVETRPDGTTVVHWLRNASPPLALAPTRTPSIVSAVTPNKTPVAVPGKKSTMGPEYANLSLEEKYDLAVKAVNRGDWLRADAYLKNYIQIDASRPLALYLLGFVQRREGDLLESISSYQAYLATNPTSKFRFSAASELVYLYAKASGYKCADAVDKLESLLFDQRAAAYGYDVETGDRVRVAWQNALRCRGGEYRTWYDALKKLSVAEYEGPEALKGKPAK